MTKEMLVLLVVVAAISVGIFFAVQKASSNEDDWNSYRAVEPGDLRASVTTRFSAISEDFHTLTDAGGMGFGTDYKESTRLGGVRLLVVRSQNDAFIFGFDKDDRLVYKQFRRPQD